MYDNIEEKPYKHKKKMEFLEAGFALFSEGSIDAVTLEDVAKACGHGVATVYRYFGTKTSITIAAMTHLWSSLKHTYDKVFETETFQRQPGIKRLNDLMRMYLLLFDSHGAFMRLVGEFDLMLQSEDIPKESLYEYERSIINFYPYMESAYQAGVQDGTVRSDVDFKLFYLTFGHSMLELCKKLLRGELLPSDDFSAAKEELSMLVNIAVSYLRKENEARS